MKGNSDMIDTRRTARTRRILDFGRKSRVLTSPDVLSRIEVDEEGISLRDERDGVFDKGEH